MKRIVIIPILLFTLSLTAAPVGEKQARAVAERFFSKAPATRSGSTPTIELEWAGFEMGQSAPSNLSTRTRNTAEVNDDALMYIYNRTDAKGFIIVAGDDCAKRKIIAFSHDNNFNSQNMSEGAQAILDAWCRDIADARIKGVKSSDTRYDDDENVGNIVRQYETAQWGQTLPFCDKCPLMGGKYLAKTGCVATAAAILCRYHEWPEKGVGTIEGYSYKREGYEMTIPSNTLGYVYKYEKFPLTYRGSYDSEGRDGVAQLMYDLGTSAEMNYGRESSSGNITKMSQSFVTHFGYSKQMLYLFRSSYSEEEWYEMLRKNLDNCGPTYYRGTSYNDVGHAFLLVGYTDAGYFSTNYGQEGRGDGFYLLPNIVYYIRQKAVFNMVPDRDGTSKHKSCLRLSSKTISGVKYNGIHTDAAKYEVNEAFQCFIYPTNAGLFTFKGSLCIAHCDKNGTIKKVLLNRNLTNTALSTSGYKVSVVLKNQPEAGDRLRVLYKGEDETSWTQARRETEDIVEEVIICLSPEEVAKNIEFDYDKATKSLTFGSSYATQCSISNLAGVVVASSEAIAGSTSTINLATLSSGEYNISFAASGKPYTVKLKL